MKCPECEEDFGYLHLTDRVKTKDYTKFKCPNCSVKLNNMSLLKISKRQDFFIYGGLVVLIFVLAVESIFFEGAMSTLSVVIILTICPISILLGYLEMRKIDSSYYNLADKHNDT
jgi:DNA-directed RNA polymerase subunit RPC12/RpoP